MSFKEEILEVITNHCTLADLFEVSDVRDYISDNKGRFDLGDLFDQDQITGYIHDNTNDFPIGEIYSEEEIIAYVKATYEPSEIYGDPVIVMAAPIEALDTARIHLEEAIKMAISALGEVKKIIAASTPEVSK